jgi:hypothetical protein
VIYEHREERLTFQRVLCYLVNSPLTTYVPERANAQCTTFHLRKPCSSREWYIGLNSGADAPVHEQRHL